MQASLHYYIIYCIYVGISHMAFVLLAAISVPVNIDI